MNDQQSPSSDETPEISHQPTLPDLELPDYHGRTPVGMRTSLTGAGNRVARAHGIGDRVVLVIEAKVKRAGHEDTDDGLLYTETLKVSDLFEIDSEPGARLLSHLRSQYRQARDAAEGKAPIDGLGDVGWTDANGIVLTPEELAERRNDPVALLGAPDMTPAVVIYDNGDRFLWPDEYPRDFPRPRAGDPHEAGTVVELVHHATGETIEAARPVVDEVSVELDDDQADDDGAPEAAPELDDPDPFPAGEELDDAELDPEDAYEAAAGIDDEPEYAEDEDGYADVVPFERPAGKPEPPALPGEEELAERLPTSHDFAAVNVTVPKLIEALAEVDDVARLRRLIEAEKQGRGRGLEARKGALDALYARLAELGAANGGE